MMIKHKETIGGKIREKGEESEEEKKRLQSFGEVVVFFPVC